MSEENTNTVEPTEKPSGEERKSRELLNELKEARAKLADFERQQEEQDAEAAKKKGDYEALLKKEQEKAAKSLKEREEALSQSNARINQLITESTLNGIIAQHDVRPELSKALMAYLKSELTITDDGAMFGDKTPDEFAKEFFGSDEGKSFLKPVTNSGAGATGNSGGEASTPDIWDFTKYADMKKTDPALAAVYAKKHGKNF